MEVIRKRPSLPSQGEEEYPLSSSPSGRLRGAKRPVILTIICILGILWSLLNFIFVFSPFIRKISEVAPAIYGIIVALEFISFIGIWHMKRWGVYLFISSFFAKTIFSLMIDDLSYVGIGLSFIFIIFFLVFYRRMSEEL